MLYFLIFKIPINCNYDNKIKNKENKITVNDIKIIKTDQFVFSQNERKKKNKFLKDGLHQFNYFGRYLCQIIKLYKLTKK